MTKNVVTVSPDASIDAVLWVLLTRGFGGVPVVEEGHLVGIVTSSDLLRGQVDGDGLEVPSWDAAVDPAELPFEPGGVSVRTLAGLTAADVMTKVVLALPPEAPIAMAAALMSLERIHRVVVIEEDEICGLVSSIDISRWLARTERYAIPEQGDE
jgi:CBS domain-containing protein